MRSLSSSRWYIPLVASTEVVRRSSDLTVLDPTDTIGTLPPALPIPQDDAIMWLDAMLASSIYSTDSAVYRVRDRSGSENHATQGFPAQQPLLTSPWPGFDFRD